MPTTTPKTKTIDDPLAKRLTRFVLKYVAPRLLPEATRELAEICLEAMREGVRMKAQAELEASRDE